MEQFLNAKPILDCRSHVRPISFYARLSQLLIPFHPIRSIPNVLPTNHKQLSKKNLGHLSREQSTYAEGAGIFREIMELDDGKSQRLAC